MKVVVIIQARTGSSRLPNKVLLPIEGKTVLEHIYLRLKYCKKIDEIVIATSSDSSDKDIVNLCLKNNFKNFIGSLDDVLDRYYCTARHFKADIIVRITGDCPVIDPIIVDEVISNFKNGNFDIYTLSGDFPDGLDCQVFSFKALEKSWKLATLPSDREHVGAYIEKTKPELFNIGGLNKFKNLSHHRWTLDEMSDYIFLKEIYSRLYKKKKIFLTDDILNLLKKEPHLNEINLGITRNEGYLQSLKEDNK